MHKRLHYNNLLRSRWKNWS